VKTPYKIKDIIQLLQSPELIPHWQRESMLRTVAHLKLALAGGKGKATKAQIRKVLDDHFRITLANWRRTQEVNGEVPDATIRLGVQNLEERLMGDLSAEELDAGGPVATKRICRARLVTVLGSDQCKELLNANLVDMQGKAQPWDLNCGTLRWGHPFWLKVGELFNQNDLFNSILENDPIDDVVAAMGKDAPKILEGIQHCPLVKKLTPKELYEMFQDIRKLYQTAFQNCSRSGNHQQFWSYCNRDAVVGYFYKLAHGDVPELHSVAAASLGKSQEFQSPLGNVGDDDTAPPLPSTEEENKGKGGTTNELLDVLKDMSKEKKVEDKVKQRLHLSTQYSILSSEKTKFEDRLLTLCSTNGDEKLLAGMKESCLKSLAFVTRQLETIMKEMDDLTASSSTN